MSDAIDDLKSWPADMRRAAALLAHHAADDGAGVMAVIEEAEQLGRTCPLLFALPSVIAQLAANWHTAATATKLQHIVNAFAAGEAAEQGIDE